MRGPNTIILNGCQTLTYSTPHGEAALNQGAKMIARSNALCDWTFMRGRIRLYFLFIGTYIPSWR